MCLNPCLCLISRVACEPLVKASEVDNRQLNLEIAHRVRCLELMEPDHLRWVLLNEAVLTITRNRLVVLSRNRITLSVPLPFESFIDFEKGQWNRAYALKIRGIYQL